MFETRIYETNRGPVCGSCVAELAKSGEHLREAKPYPFLEWRGGYCAACRRAMVADLAPGGRTEPTDPVYWHAESGGSALCSSEADVEPLTDDRSQVTCPRCREMSACEGCREQSIPGVIVGDFADRGPSVDGRVFVTRCDVCGLYADDVAAAEAVSRRTGWPVLRSYDRDDDLDPRARAERAGTDYYRPYFGVSLMQMEEAVYGRSHQSRIPALALPERPRTADEARAAIQAVKRLLGPGYHPDTRGEDYRFSPPGAPDHLERTFDSEAAVLYDRIHEAAFALLGQEEVYVVCQETE